MTGKIIDILKDGNIIIPKLLLTNYKKLKMTDEEFIVLVYLLNNREFDPERISRDLELKTVDVLNIINNLTKKDIISLDRVTNNNVAEEYVSCDELYKKLALILMENKKEVKDTNIYDKFEKEFARTLSPMEYEIITAWLEDDMTEEIILLALKEAVYNGVSNLRYIDKILYEWKKKGIKNKADIQKSQTTKKKNKKEVFDYDWLNE